MLRMHLPQISEALADSRHPTIRFQIKQRFEHKRMLQLGTRQLQIAPTRHLQIVEQHDIDIERARGVARLITTATVLVFKRVQPVIERLGREIRAQGDGEIEEIIAGKS